MYFLIKAFLISLVIGLFLYAKLLPYKEKLKGGFKSVFNFYSALFTPILNGLRTFIKPFEVGTGLSVDMSQIALLIIVLLFLLII